MNTPSHTHSPSRSQVAVRTTASLRAIGSNTSRTLKRVRSVVLTVVLGTISFAAATVLADDSAGQHAAPSSTAAGELVAVDATVNTVWLTEARHDYPLETCAISGETLGDMGEPREYVYKVSGQPDRLVRFCCKGCVKDFNKAPAKFLELVDAAVRAKTERAK